jgi:C-terminal processing protease CtpA/Prc
MGNSESSDILAYQVVRVLPNSPAHTAGLSPYFDFILQIDSISVEDENMEFFSDYIAKSQNQPLKMTVYSIKTTKIRGMLLIFS